MGKRSTIRVAHLGGVDAGYQMHHACDATKPTLILVNSMTTTSNLFEQQFSDTAMTNKMNVIAIEVLGHGLTRPESEHFTYWDTAIMNLQVMETLGISRAFVLGTSQGGWITVRMALLAPDKIEGIIPLGTSMDYESERARRLGCWDGPSGLLPVTQGWTTTHATPEFTPSDDYCKFLADSGLGADCDPAVREYWTQTLKATYAGDNGRKRIRMAAINLRERDGLHSRLSDVRCPVLWMHGTKHVVYSVSNAQEEIKLFTNSKEAQLVVVAGGQHFLSASNHAEVNVAVVDFVGKWADKHI